jgi:hypothetical protein
MASLWLLSCLYDDNGHNTWCGKSAKQDDEITTWSFSLRLKCGEKIKVENKKRRNIYVSISVAEKIICVHEWLQMKMKKMLSTGVLIRCLKLYRPELSANQPCPLALRRCICTHIAIFQRHAAKDLFFTHCADKSFTACVVQWKGELTARSLRDKPSWRGLYRLSIADDLSLHNFDP